jgi:hypothetical protein
LYSREFSGFTLPNLPRKLYSRELSGFALPNLPRKLYSRELSGFATPNSLESCTAVSFPDLLSKPLLKIDFRDYCGFFFMTNFRSVFALPALFHCMEQ